MESIVYGSKSMSVAEVGEEVHRHLGLVLEVRESSYFGAEYLNATTDLDEELTVVDNSVRDDEGEVTHPDFAEYRTILEVEETARGEEFVAKLAGVAGLDLLKRTPWS